MRSICVSLVLIGLSGSAAACALSGTAHRTDGSAVDGTVTVSTSWNSKKAFPRKGRFDLDLGSAACGKRVTVYANGYRVGEYKLPSIVRIIMKGSRPLR